MSPPGPRHRAPQRARRRFLSLGLAVGLLLAAASAYALWPETGPEEEPVAAFPTEFSVGVTHTQNTINSFTPDEAAQRAQSVLRAVAPVQNQHLMGWGALNPEVSPGEYDFDSLDERIEMITGMGAEPVLTLCCAPDWMKGGEAGSTDWSEIETAPTPEHFDDFARLAAVAAERYPQVRRFLVWNELKGFFDEDANTWDAAGYTELYNQVYEAVREVRPDALIGGPYVVYDSWSSPEATSHPSEVSGPWGVLDQRPLDVTEYWLENAVDADFIAVDARTQTRDEGLVTTDFEAVQKLGAVTEWVRERTDLPIWWAELYTDSSDPSAGAGDARSAALLTEALVTVARAGASGALLWQPQEGDDEVTAALFTDTRSDDGGQELPLARLLRAVLDDLRTDPPSVQTSWDEDRSLWTVTTPDGALEWSPETGLRAPDDISAEN